MRGDRTQILLIAAGLAATALFAVFFLRELFPEYKIYQNAYVELEQFRTSYTGQPAPAFRSGIKQIVLESKNKGPVTIDRCTSCHVALQFQHFSPTQIAYDINGNMILDEEGIPKKEPNPTYIWAKLDEKVADLTDPKTNDELIASGNQSKVSKRLAEAEELKGLKVAHVGEHEWDMAKVLQMHPLIGKETRPFEYHPIDEYGCTSCHSGNGRGLTTLKAHGPVFDGQYEEEEMGPVPQFLEKDEKNDPRFSKVFNAKPGHELLFQTTPILVGSLMEAKCVQCHQSSESTLRGTAEKRGETFSKVREQTSTLATSYSKDLDALTALFQLKNSVLNLGVAKTVEQLKLDAEDLSLPAAKRQQLTQQAQLLTLMVGGEDGLRKENDQPARDVALKKLDERITEALGSKELATKLEKLVDPEGAQVAEIINQFIEEHATKSGATGPIFQKAKNLTTKQAYVDQLEEATLTNKTEELPRFTTQVDRLTQNFHRGEELYINQACYACHRISGFARGGIGPELTEIGKFYPWYIKESIVWPQADLKTSTMPNYHLDHEELEDLVTFLLAQRGQPKKLSDTEYQRIVTAWEAGKKLPWELPVSPIQMHDTRYGLTVFATEGCAACHRLRGFDSNVGFAIEKQDPPFSELYKEREWFKQTIPEMITGSDLVRAIETYAAEIDSKIVDGVREGGLIEEIEAKYPGNTQSFYSNFQYARRARNDALKDDPEKLKEWQDRVHRVLMMYVQEYGYGRIIGPKPNWAGVYRSDEWLMEHFRKPSALVAKSIMPVFPFDDTKFYALTYMLDVIGAQNRDADKKIWNYRGFNPEIAYELYCANCHGNQRVGNGPVAEWIYPVPKNLRNADFMRNLTPARARQSLIHGVKGGPMPPWGEAPAKATTDGIPVLTVDQIDILVDWLFSTLPGRTVIQKEEDVPKWQYGPEDILEEIKKEGSQLAPDPLSMVETGSRYLASLDPQPMPSDVEQVFDIVPNPDEGPNENLYYIKRKYYTQENLEAGRAYFELNCAVCHGRDGDGAGNRSGVMQDAKPRMLINLPWLETRDDLRLIRSIKYGVTGTSMQPWGDQTSSLQRMQMVMYIRSLSSEQTYRERLYGALYTIFEESRLAVENGRMHEYPEVEETRKQLQSIAQEQRRVSRQVKNGEASPSDAAQLYQKELELKQQLRRKENIDSIYQQLRNLVLQESKIYEELGLGIIALPDKDELFGVYMSYLQMLGQPVTFSNGKLKLNTPNTEKRKALLQSLEEALKKRINTTKSQLSQTQGKIATPQRKEEAKGLQAELDNLEKLRRNLISGSEEANRIRKRQQTLIGHMNDSNDSRNSKDNGSTAL